MGNPEILSRLTAFVTDEFLEGDARSLTPRTPLLEWGVLDSLSMLALLTFIEQRLHIQVPDELVRPEHFQNLERLCALLSELDHSPDQRRTTQEVASSTH